MAQDIALNLAWAGHDTYATAIMRLLWLLPQHPAVQQKLRSEQQDALSQHGEAITEAVLRDCPYLEATVKELLRVEASGCTNTAALPWSSSFA